MKRISFLEALLVVGIFILILIFFSKKDENGDSELLEKYHNGILILNKINQKEDSIHKWENKLRNLAKKADSATIAHIKSLKKKDSLYQVKHINTLMRESRNLTDEELDKKVKEIIDEINSNSGSDH